MDKKTLILTPRVGGAITSIGAESYELVDPAKGRNDVLVIGQDSTHHLLLTGARAKGGSYGLADLLIA